METREHFIQKIEDLLGELASASKKGEIDDDLYLELLAEMSDRSGDTFNARKEELEDD